MSFDRLAYSTERWLVTKQDFNGYTINLQESSDRLALTMRIETVQNPFRSRVYVVESLEGKKKSERKGKARMDKISTVPVPRSPVIPQVPCV